MYICEILKKIQQDCIFSTYVSIYLWWQEKLIIFLLMYYSIYDGKRYNFPIFVMICNILYTSLQAFRVQGMVVLSSLLEFGTLGVWVAMVSLHCAFFITLFVILTAYHWQIKNLQNHNWNFLICKWFLLFWELIKPVMNSHNNMIQEDNLALLQRVCGNIFSCYALRLSFDWY